MNIPHSTRRHFERGAFTLIELLVVITIIAVLAGLLLPVGQKVLENSKKVSTKSTETQIISAVNSYQTEYGQYPVVPIATPIDTTFGIGDNADYYNHVLFNVLRAINSTDAKTSALNSRQISYFESKNVKNVASARDGFIPPNPGTIVGNPNGSKTLKLGAGDLLDPWGNMYIVRIDAAYTNAVLNPYSNGDTPAYNDSDDASKISDPNYADAIRTGVISWTVGNDGVQASKTVTPSAPYALVGDDVDSWQ